MIAFPGMNAWEGVAPDTTPRWYACYTRSRHEKKVDRLLVERGVESFLPVVQRTHRWTDRSKVVSVALFPSYVFARFSLDRLYRVLAVPGVTSVVRREGRPVEVPDEEVMNVRHFADTLSVHALEPQLVAMPERGTLVRIVAGPFAGVSGKVVDHRNRSRVLVGLTAIGMGMQLEVDAELVEVSPG